MNASDQELFLAAGPQSGGTTLVSWCFLQRSDMDGVLDLRPDVLARLPDVDAPRLWAKATIASFRFQEIAEYYRWQGYRIHPLLIVRDVFHVYSSMTQKPYTFNGTTAEDPPLQLRLYRYLEDWRLFRQHGWPVVQYESLLRSPEQTLRNTCSALGLAWDEAMLSWPKRREDIAEASIGSPTFLRSLGNGGALETIDPQRHRPARLRIPKDVAEWIASEFSEYNDVNGYALPDLSLVEQGNKASLSAVYEGTRRDVTLKQLQRALGARESLHRLLVHPVIGRAVRYWARWINPGLSQVYSDDVPPDR